MPDDTLRKKSVLLLDTQIDIVSRLAKIHDREFSAQLRVIINEAGRQLDLKTAAAARGGQ